MTNKEFISALAEKTGYSENKTSQLAAVLANEIACQLEDEKSVMIMGFGTFEVKARPARVARNPRTGEEVKIAASKAPSFKAGKALKEKVNE